MKPRRLQLLDNAGSVLRTVNLDLTQAALDLPPGTPPTYHAGDLVWYVPWGWGAYAKMPAVVLKDSYWTVADRSERAWTERVRIGWTEAFFGERSATVDTARISRRSREGQL